MLFRIVGTVIIVFDFAAVVRLLFADVSDVDWMYPETERFLTITLLLLSFCWFCLGFYLGFWNTCSSL